MLFGSSVIKMPSFIQQFVQADIKPALPLTTLGSSFNSKTSSTAGEGNSVIFKNETEM